MTTDSAAGERPAPQGMRTFLIVWIGQLISIIGSGLTSFALGVWIFQETGQATPFALTVLLASLPRIVLAPFAGALADRYDRRRLMILADSGNALVTLAVALLFASGRLAIWHVYTIALAGSLFSTLQEPAYSAAISLLVPKRDLSRANGLVQLGQSADLLVAPLLAGVLFVVIGLQGILLIDAATFVFAVGALLLVRFPAVPPAPEEERARRSLLADAAFGWHYLRARTGLFGLLLYYALVNFLLNLAAVLMGPLVLSYSTAAGLGAVQTAMGLGMLIGSVVMSAWRGPRRRVRAVIAFIAVGALGLILTGVQASPVVAGAGLFVLAVAVPLSSAPSQAIFQSKVAPGVQGRVFAMRTLISRSMMPLAFLSAGPLADLVFEPALRPGGLLAASAGALIGTGPGRGIGLMYVLAGLAGLFASALAFAHPRIRRVEDELPDALPEAPPVEASAGEAAPVLATESAQPAGS